MKKIASNRNYRLVKEAAEPLFGRMRERAKGRQTAEEMGAEKHYIFTVQISSDVDLPLDNAAINSAASQFTNWFTNNTPGFDYSKGKPNIGYTAPTLKKKSWPKV